MTPSDLDPIPALRAVLESSGLVVAGKNAPRLNTGRQASRDVVLYRRMDGAIACFSDSVYADVAERCATACMAAGLKPLGNGFWSP